MRTLLLTCALFAVAFGIAAGTATAAPPPLVNGCNALTNPCWNGSLLCFWFSQQMPTCLPVGLT